ncbi:MAG: phosphate ABC transporter permease [Pseudomonadota bacterium]
MNDPQLVTGESTERFRLLKDRVFAWVMAAGGVAVLAAILLIFVYLFFVVVPMFRPAAIETRTELRSVMDGPAHIALDEYTGLALVINEDGDFRFIDTETQASVAGGKLDPKGGSKFATISTGDPASHLITAAIADGKILLAKPYYSISYQDDKRVVKPSIGYPLGEELFEIDNFEGMPRLLAGEYSEEETTVAASTGDGRIFVLHIGREESFLDEEVTITESTQIISTGAQSLTHLVLDVDQRELYAIDAAGSLYFYDIQNKDDIKLVDRVSVIEPDREVSVLRFLSGGISLLIGDSGGKISQWFPVRDASNNYTMMNVRSFEAFTSPVVDIAPEYFRKGFAAIDADGNLGVFHTTAGRTLINRRVSEVAFDKLAMSPRADALLLAERGGKLKLFDVHNEHPEVSFASIWSEIWYESREKPDYIWQSSSASSDFEPKFSLTPLTFGTLKAAFYAMLFAMPLAIGGAIYTAYFMTPRMRAFVKPSIEIMAAMPTVILGFLAGLWLAPLIELYLTGVLLAFIVLPLSVVLASYAWSVLPATLSALIPEGWEALALIPVMCLALWLCVEISQPLEFLVFGQSLTQWLSTEMGIAYDQRNSLVVGMAIGFAVIPTIFSISEDAIFSVPRQLTMGSLALGATTWQTLTQVVILTASPGIFSAVMIGLGRAVGETMIVLMATGNTPIMDFNIFQGFRALSANIAVEMPESEVDSTHYRILFLAALVLFLVTFCFNTVAEVVRQRLREKYASL